MINDTTTPKESNAAKQKTGGGWMRRFVLHLRSRRVLKLQERIAQLTAENEYWKGKVTLNGTLPERICDDIGGRLGEIAALRVRLDYLQNAPLERLARSDNTLGGVVGVSESKGETR